MKKEDLKRANEIDNLLEFATDMVDYPDEELVVFKISYEIKDKYNKECKKLIVQLLGSDFIEHLRKEVSNRIMQRINHRVDELIKEFESL